MAPTMPLRQLSSLVAIASALLAAGCGGDNGGPVGPQPTSIAISGGNSQAAKYGTPVPTPPSVVVTNAAGPMVGVAVTFSAPVGGGTVDGATVTSNAQGVATVGGWVLGPTPGMNTLKATAGNISVNFEATAITGPPTTLVIRTGNDQTWVQQSLLPVSPSVTVTDGLFPVPGARVVFSVSSGGGSVSGPVQTTNATGAAVGVATVGGWRLGTATTNTLIATVQNSTIAPVTFSATAQPLVISAVNKVEGDNQTGFAGNFAAQKVTVAVLNQFGQPTEGVPVTYAVTGGGSVPSGTTTGLNGQAAIPYWRFGAAGAQSLNVSAGGAAPVTFTATANAVPISNFRINLIVPPGAPALAPAVQAAFDAAKARWQSIIVGGLTPVQLTGSDVIGPFSINTGLPNVGTIPCIPLVSNTTIQDVNIYVYVRPIDGNTGTNILGLATPVYLRDNLLPFAGCMIFDEANIDALIGNGLDAVILHEMAHVFGFGTLWDEKGLLVGKCPASTTPSFSGPSSQQGFLAALVPGGVYNDPITPVEGEGSCDDGTRDGHWSESVMGNELMTGFLSPTSNPLSAITSASLRDFGYVVNDVPSDPYTVPSVSAALRTGAVPEGLKLHEIRPSAPIIITDTRGRTLQVIDR